MGSSYLRGLILDHSKCLKMNQANIYVLVEAGNYVEFTTVKDICYYYWKLDRKTDPGIT